MFVTLKSLLRTLVLPPAGPLLLAVVGAFLVSRARASARARRAGVALLALGLGSLWLLATPVIADALWRVAEREPVLDLGHAADAQAIVILAGGSVRAAAPEYAGEAAPGGELLERLTYGAYLAHRTGLPVLVSGTAAEAQAMQASLVRDLGVTPRWIENHSRDTFENAQYSAALLRAQGVTRILLVTDAVHEHRAAAEFAAAGLAVRPAPTGLWVPYPSRPGRYVPHIDALRRSTLALYELLGDVARQAFAGLGVRRQHG
ncbi:MAG TPA: YdcF family protein [Steroidobacteraceae bacterium]|nr:YdcF family protein [Steroidobacteraceae bacterium]